MVDSDASRLEPLQIESLTHTESGALASLSGVAAGGVGGDRANLRLGNMGGRSLALRQSSRGMSTHWQSMILLDSSPLCTV